MNKLIIGIDVSKNDLDVAFWQNDKSFFLGKYPNNQYGFQTIYQDVEAKKQKINADTVLMVMEPTGGYEQHFAYFAFNKGWEVSLPNPANVRSWYKGIGKRAYKITYPILINRSRYWRKPLRIILTHILISRSNSRISRQFPE